MIVPAGGLNVAYVPRELRINPLRTPAELDDTPAIGPDVLMSPGLMVTPPGALNVVMVPFVSRKNPCEAPPESVQAPVM